MAIYTKLMGHQDDIVDFILDKKYAAIFADYGTGKTLCALDYINKHHALRKILVVSSKTAVKSTWPQEIKKHTNFRYVHLLGSVKKKYMSLSLGLRASKTVEGPYHSGLIRPVIFLINFDGVKNVYNYLVQANFDAIIIDESTKIKSPKTMRTKVLWKLGRAVKRRFIMTGFPVTENLAEIYSQIKFLDFGAALGNSYYGFLDQYFFKAGFKYVPKKKSVRQIFDRLKPFCIRVTNDVIKLPPQIYEEKMLEQSPKQQKLMSDLYDYFRVEFGRVKIDTQYIFTLINKALQICDGFIQDDKGNLEAFDTAKDAALVDMLEDIDPVKNKVLIWANFRYSVAKIKRICKKLGYNTLTLTGATENESGVVRKFQNMKSGYNILIATQKKAAESITLTSCRYAIYYSNNWSYDLRANSEARIRRKGSEKHKSVIYTDLILNNDIEKLVYDSLRRKKNLVNMLKDNFQNIVSVKASKKKPKGKVVR